jgi:tetratricopeptide (TPR) repeat protein
MNPTSSDSVFAQVNELLVEQACADSSEAKSQALRRARKILEKLINEHPHNADLQHALGICWYHEPEWSEEMRMTIEGCFRSALQLEPGHQFATLYLGHFCFDERRYEEALRFFTSIDDSYFESIGHHWRVLKNRELVLSSRLYLKLPVQLTDIEDLCLAFESADDVDVPVPTELVKCLSTLVKDSNEKLTDIVKRVLEMIRRIGFEKAKSISDRIEVLRESVRNAQNGV